MANDYDVRTLARTVSQSLELCGSSALAYTHESRFAYCHRMGHYDCLVLSYRARLHFQLDSHIQAFDLAFAQSCYLTGESNYETSYVQIPRRSVVQQ